MFLPFRRWRLQVEEAALKAQELVEPPIERRFPLTTEDRRFLRQIEEAFQSPPRRPKLLPKVSVVGFPV